jgi:phosphonopyruvate decarboxylase
MIEPHVLFDSLKTRGVEFFAGVPDSLLASFCAYVDDHGQRRSHVITANEGNAVALAMGHQMATGKIPAVYMQNSGLGNAVNPLTSLAAAEVYRIPILLVIGWRGEPGVKDEPQHVKQGAITPAQLDLLDIPYRVLEAQSEPEGVLDDLFATLSQTRAPAALLVRKDTFSAYKSKRPPSKSHVLTREQALRSILSWASPEDLVVSTTGKTSREVFELRVERGEPQRDFLTVGGMGHSSSIALGVALGQPSRRVICLDGDGSVLMHLGALPIIGSLRPRNIFHVVLNNAAHESVGGQPTVAGDIDFSAISDAVGYRAYRVSNDLESLQRSWKELSALEGPVLLEVRISIGSRSDLGRPTSTAEENKTAFICHAREI